MGSVQTTIDFATISYTDGAGNLHGLDGKYTTPEKLHEQLTEREQREVISEFRRTSAQWRMMRLMAEEIIELRKLVSK